MAQLDPQLEILTEKLANTTIPQEGVSFAGQSLKLNTLADAQVVVDKINACPYMEYLNLEGNTLGVEAAEVIAKALEKQPYMKRALWKDMFTGRMKNEIPIALKHLSRGLMTANAQLEVLDLSDNASGPIGVEGILDLIKSPTCYTLKELKLNNMGLGIGGAKLLAKALRECYQNSKAAGTPLGLKVFIAGRNRLENEGASALAEVFEEMGSLEEIQVPQNGIYYRGIQALSKAFANNPNLREINLNDNTLNPEGSSAISKSLAHLQNLVKLDLGDCLMKSKGVMFLAEALENGHLNLEEVVLSFNSVKTPGALALIQALEKKHNLKKLSLDGNKFGLEGIEKVKEAAEHIGKSSTLTSLSEDEGSESDESGDEENGGSDEEDYSQDESDDPEVKEPSISSSPSEGFLSDPDHIIESGYTSSPQTGTAREFLANSTKENFDKLGDVAVSSIINEVKEKPFDSQLDELLVAIIKVSGLIPKENGEKAKECWLMNVTEDLYEVLFDWAGERNQLSRINNILPALLGLIKSEETNKWKKTGLENSIFAVEHLLRENLFPDSTKNILNLLMTDLNHKQNYGRTFK